MIPFLQVFESSSIPLNQDPYDLRTEESEFPIYGAERLKNVSIDG